jgi:hypothetical protein
MRTWTAVSMALWLAASGVCHAHSFPVKAPSLKADLVQAYPPCTEPNVTTLGGRPACLSTVEEDPDCLFGSRGFGTLNATVSGNSTSIKVAAKLKGLDPLCENRTLSAAFTVRTTTDDCMNDHCTVADYQITGGSCTVKKGKCAFSTSIPSGYTPGAGSEMTIVTCGVNEGARTAFRCGIMVK